MEAQVETPTQSEPRRRYSKDFKLRVLEEVQEKQLTVEQVCQKFCKSRSPFTDLLPNLLWVPALRLTSFGPGTRFHLTPPPCLRRQATWQRSGGYPAAGHGSGV